MKACKVRWAGSQKVGTCGVGCLCACQLGLITDERNRRADDLGAGTIRHSAGDPPERLLRVSGWCRQERDCEEQTSQQYKMQCAKFLSSYPPKSHLQRVAIASLAVRQQGGPELRPYANRSEGFCCDLSPLFPLSDMQ
jgi:hypothetical protein